MEKCMERLNIFSKNKAYALIIFLDNIIILCIYNYVCVHCLIHVFISQITL